MKNTKVITGLLLLVCLVGGYAAGRGYKTYEIDMEKKVAEMNHNMENMQMSDMEMEHGHTQVGPYRLVPKVKLEAIKDSMDGYNLKITTQNFYFTPQSAGKAVTQNTGHAHVFVNGMKVGRAYGQWYYLSGKNLQNGTNTISVILNANDHTDWITKDGKEIESSVEVVK